MFMVVVIIFFIGLISLVFSYKHILNILLRLEFLMVGLILLFFLWLKYRRGEAVFILYYIVFIVGEGVLGLRLLVRLVRWYGRDLFIRFRGINYLYCGV